MSDKFEEFCKENKLGRFECSPIYNSECPRNDDEDTNCEKCWSKLVFELQQFKIEKMKNCMNCKHEILCKTLEEFPKDNPPKCWEMEDE